jgi:hypothetical protein
LSDDANAPGPAADPSPRRRGGARAYFETWLLSTFLVVAFTMLWRVGLPPEHEEWKRGGLAAIARAPLLALLALPALWLLRLFDERSPSTWLRCLRRVFLGLACGAFPAALCAALVAKDEPGSREAGGAILLLGVLFGIVAGVIDSMRLDRAA